MTNDKIKLVLIDNDTIFRLGLSAALEPFADLEITNQATTATALEIISQQQQDNFPDLVILGLDDNPEADSPTSLQLCQQLNQEYPHLPILLLSQSLSVAQTATARQWGVNGYCPKSIEITELIVALRQVAAGKVYWHQPINPSNQELATTDNNQPIYIRVPKLPPWFFQQQQRGLTQIEQQLAAIEKKLQDEYLSVANQVFWRGRQRELLTAYWLVKKIGKKKLPSVIKKAKIVEDKLDISAPSLQFKTQSQALVSSDFLLDNVLAKIESGLANLTGLPLEIEILIPEKQKELLYLVSQQFEKILEELRLLKIEPEELSTRKKLILRDLWQSSTIDFLGRYYHFPQKDDQSSMIDILMQEAGVVEQNTLGRIPFFVDLCSYFLFSQPLAIDNIPYRPNSPEAMARSEILLHNLIIQVANGVVQFLLNNFSQIETVKYSLFSQKFFSSRAIAKFRNNLSWRTRSQELFIEPQAIFESKYYLYIISGNGIRQISIYAPRQDELNQLEGVQWAVTMALETRDALAPRLKGVLSFVGGGVVYFLTQVIGRGLGLIGRGIIQGIGNSLNK